MSKPKKTSAAIVGLLDAIKAEGIQPVDDINIMAAKVSNHVAKTAITMSPDRTDNDVAIPYQIKMIDTSLCKPWHLANRLREYLTEESCADLIESMKKVGQQIPALVRRNKNGEGYDLICGARRLFACERLGIKIKAAVVNLSDKEALLAMDAENRPREDISPYERARDYKRWIASGIYYNYTEIRESIGVKKSLFSQLMALADLDEDIVKAFGHPANLKQKWGYELQLICKKDTTLESKMLQTARELIGQSLPSETVFKKLRNVRNDEKSKPHIEPIWITNNLQKKIFKVTYSPAGQAQLTFGRGLSPRIVEKIINNAKLLIEEEQ